MKASVGGTAVAPAAIMQVKGLLARALLMGSLITAACGRPDAAAATGLAGTGPATTSPDSDRPARVPRTQPLRIFQDLTAFDWYRQGEPLVHEGRAYQPSGPPVRAEPGTMRKIGEYGGVDIYALDADAEDSSLYVPVYENYWLAFVVSGESNGPRP